MSRPEYDKDIAEVLAVADRNAPDGVGVVIYTERPRGEWDYFWDLRDMQEAG